jgi:hypothetical protein
LCKEICDLTTDEGFEFAFESLALLFPIRWSLWSLPKYLTHWLSILDASSCVQIWNEVEKNENEV